MAVRQILYDIAQMIEELLYINLKGIAIIIFDVCYFGCR